MQPEISIVCVANLYSRQMTFVNVGDKELGHTHPFDHTTLLAHGSLRVSINGVMTDFTAPQHLYINKDVEHEIEALEAGTVAYCIHALRDGHGVEDIIDPDGIPAGLTATAFSLAVANSENRNPTKRSN